MWLTCNCENGNSRGSNVLPDDMRCRGAINNVMTAAVCHSLLQIRVIIFTRPYNARLSGSSTQCTSASRDKNEHVGGVNAA